jgi:hypothetical protein
MKKCNFWANMFAILGFGVVINLILVCSKYNLYKQISEYQDIKSEFQTDLFEELNVETDSPLADSIDYYDTKIDSLYNLL